MTAANSLLLLPSSPLHQWHTSAAHTRLSERGGVSQTSGMGLEYSDLRAGGTYKNVTHELSIFPVISFPVRTRMRGI